MKQAVYCIKEGQAPMARKILEDELPWAKLDKEE
jgi:hypothetical protein